jgi:hypothetical protein
MASENFRLQVKVVMLAGREILHEYELASPLAADIDAIEEETKGLLYALLSEIYKANPLFVMNNPPVLYNRDHLVRIEWDVSGPSQNIAEVRRRIAGLNIPR